MNVTEAQDFQSMLQSVTTSATEFQRAAGVASAERLAKRARQALNAGPVGAQVAGLVQDLQDAVRVAADDEQWAVRVTLPAAPVQNNTTVGGVL